MEAELGKSEQPKCWDVWSSWLLSIYSHHFLTKQLKRKCKLFTGLFKPIPNIVRVKGRCRFIVSLSFRPFFFRFQTEILKGFFDLGVHFVILFLKPVNTLNHSFWFHFRNFLGHTKSHHKKDLTFHKRSHGNYTNAPGTNINTDRCWESGGQAKPSFIPICWLM